VVGRGSGLAEPTDSEANMTTTKGRRIGLLGGSFNPAHQGHREISEHALKVLGLDEVWWLVSPQNPLKDEDDMAPFAERLASARKVAGQGQLARRLHVSDLEQNLGSRYSVDTIQTLQQFYVRDHFVWIIGADNLAQMPGWHRWQDLMQSVPVAVFDRPGYTHKALAGLAARRYATNRMNPRLSRKLVASEPPAWVYLREVHNPISATKIRRSNS
jgi:nicotinate-nucleotide adenylyltransferase